MPAPPQGTIADDSAQELAEWNPEERLAEAPLNELRFGLGFLRARPQRWFESFGSDWFPLFHGLGAEASVVSVETGFVFPEELDRVTPIEIDGEVGVIGFDRRSEDVICSTVAEGLPELAGDIVMEYIERRLISTLTRNWTGPDGLECFYIPPEKTEAAEVVGVIRLRAIVGEEEVNVWFGIGPRAVERIDSMWRDEIVRIRAEQVGEIGDELETVHVEIAELAVPPAMLIDYMRGGTVVDLGLPVGTTVSVRVGERVLARGELMRFNGRFAVKITELNVPSLEAPEATTRVQISIAEVELDSVALLEISQLGAYLPTAVAVSDTVSMVISGENVAEARLGELGNRFAINVLPK